MKHMGLTMVMLSALVLTGCIYVDETGDGSRDHRLRANAEPTVGQELLDLDRARSAGVITTAEYDRAKQAILGDIN